MTEISQIPLEPMSQQFYRTIFNKYDKDQDGFISVKELSDLIEARRYDHDIPPLAVTRIHEMHDNDEDGKLNFQEFYALMTNPDMDYLFGHYVGKYLNFITPKKRRTGTTATDGKYKDMYSFCLLPVGMIIISLIEIIFFMLLHEYNKRRGICRYITHTFIDIGYFHLIVNFMIQILLHLLLDRMHLYWKILLLYPTFYLTGFLSGRSIVNSCIRLASASGEAYFLVTAHIASIILNWKARSFPAVQLLIFLIIGISDISTAIYNRYVLNTCEDVGHAALFAFGVAWLFVSINLLKITNVNYTKWVIWCISILTYSVLILLGIFFNLNWKLLGLFD